MRCLEYARSGGCPESVRSGHAGDAVASRLSDLAGDDEPRIEVGLVELDRVLGGGLVAGSVVLLGGDPGIGKSTLLLQACAKLARCCPFSTLPARNRCARWLCARGGSESTRARSASSLRPVWNDHRAAERTRPRVLVVDSVQTMYTEEVASSPGAVAQLREASARLVRYAKASGTAVFLIGTSPRRRDRGTARARAHGRHGALLRERGRQPLTASCAP
jgi:DNA repair protein RadA/Sms